MNPLLLLRVHRGAAALLALLGLSASLLVAGLPRGFEASYDESLHGIMDDTAASLRDVVVRLQPRLPEQNLTSEAEFKAKDQNLRAGLPPALNSVLDTGAGNDSHFAAKTYGTPVADRIGSPQPAAQFVNLAWLSGFDKRVRYVEGSPPGPPAIVASVPGHPNLKDIKQFDIALVKSAAEKMAIPIGTTLVLGNSHPALARVTGLFEPVAAADPYWVHNLDAVQVSVRRTPADTEEQYITALTDESGLRQLNGDDRDLNYSWVIAVGTPAVDARNAPDVIQGLNEYRSFLVRTNAGSITDYRLVAGFSELQLDTALDRILTDFLKRLATAQALMFLILGGLVVVAAGVLALAVQLMTERMRAGLSLARARGASMEELIRAVVGTVALTVVPAALAGYGLSFLLPGPVTRIVHVAPLLIVLTTVAFAAVRVAVVHRRPLQERREDVAARRPSPRRAMLEIVLVALALGGAYLLRSRGLTTGVAALGSDPFLMVVPAALTVAVALITLRCYPYLCA